MPRKKKMIPIYDLDDDSKEMKEHIKLDIILRKKKVRQYMLAEHLGVKQGTISMWKNGKTALPSCYVYDICKYLDISPNQLFGWEKC